MSTPTKYYPVQGSNKFQTVSFPITKAFAVDFGVVATGTATKTLVSFPKGSQILGFACRITEAMESSNAATIQFGFSSLMVSSAHGSATATVGTIIAPHSPTSGTVVSYEPVVLTADDTFDLIVGGNKIDTGGAGKADCFVTYVPLPQEALTTAEFLSIVTS